MHRYLASAGLNQLKNNADVDKFLYEELICGENLYAEYKNEEDSVLKEYRLSIAENISLVAITESYPSGRERIISYFPSLYQNEVFSAENCTVEEHLAGESYSGFIEDYKIGISIIFYINNNLDYRRMVGIKPDKNFNRTYLSAFGSEGRIILPIEKKLMEENEYKASKDSENLIEAAKEGDENAIEILTEAEMDTYSEVMKRINNEDVYSIVESSCIPSGVECDIYSVIGEIEAITTVKGIYTSELIYILKLNCNDIVFPMAIAESCLYGIPEVGRRFKGKIWLQGRVSE